MLNNTQSISFVILLGCCLYDSDSGKAYRVQMNTAGMVELFAGASVMSTRSAILNYIIATHDIMAIKKVKEILYMILGSSFLTNKNTFKIMSYSFLFN